MSPELDLMSSALLKNHVPPNRLVVAYPSLKPLASWVRDLKDRVEFMRGWLNGGHPPCYWLSGFFFPHGFMTATLQTYARKHLKPIDHSGTVSAFWKSTCLRKLQKHLETGSMCMDCLLRGHIGPQIGTFLRSKPPERLHQPWRLFISYLESYQIRRNFNS